MCTLVRYIKRKTILSLKHSRDDETVLSIEQTQLNPIHPIPVDIACSKSTIETPRQRVKSVES